MLKNHKKIAKKASSRFILSILVLSVFSSASLYSDPESHLAYADTTFVDSLDVSTEELGPQDVEFSSDGTKMFVVGLIGDDVNEYGCTTAFDVSTCSFTVKAGNPFPVAAQDTVPQGLAFSSDGTKMFVVGGASEVFEYDLTTAFDVSTAAFGGTSFDVSGQDTDAEEVAFSSDGTKMFVVGNINDAIHQYTLSTAFDLSDTVTFVDSFSVATQDDAPTGVTFSSNGLKMFVVGNTNDSVYEYTLEVAFDLSSPSENSGGGGCSGDCTPPTLGVYSDGTRLVTDGFSYNGNAVDVERYYTPYPLITVQVGKNNTATFKIYENLGPDNVSHFEFAFGLAEGQILAQSNARIEWDRTFDGVETVTVYDPSNALDNVSVTADTGTCDGTAIPCLILLIQHTFREPLEFDIVATNVWDSR